MPELAAHVVAHRVNENGNVVESVAFAPGDELPDWAVDAITNPKAWADEADGEPAGDGPPPQNGPGSSRDAWALYAMAHDIEPGDDASREQIISQLAADGIPVE